MAPRAASGPPVVRNGEAEHEVFVVAVSVLVHEPPSHVVLPVVVTVTLIFVVTILLIAETQSDTLLLLLSTKFPSQKTPPVFEVQSSMHVFFVSLSQLAYDFPWQVT
jgi:hypothetical protein